jgi:hypothetical protein
MKTETGGTPNAAMGIGRIAGTETRPQVLQVRYRRETGSDYEGSRGLVGASEFGKEDLRLVICARVEKR